MQTRFCSTAFPSACYSVTKKTSQWITEVTEQPTVSYVPGSLSHVGVHSAHAVALLSEGAIACHGAAKGDAVGYKGWGAIAQIRGAERRGAAMVTLRGGQLCDCGV